jgi:hypothetical protein
MRTYQVIALVAVAGLVGACAKRASTPVAATPVSANVTVSPAPGTTGVQRTTAIGVQFDHPMDPATSTGRFVVHMGDSSGPIVSGRMMWDSTFQHMTFMPDSMFAPGTMYSVYMRDGMMTRGAMMGGGSMGMGRAGMSGGRGGMAGSTMMFDHVMSGATRTGAGMMWSFTTGK